MSRFITGIVAATALGVAVPGFAWASGGYGPQHSGPMIEPEPDIEPPPKLQSADPDFDRELYQLGLNIFSGQVNLRRPIRSEKLAAEQREVLSGLRDDLRGRDVPDGVIENIDVDKLAGRLSQRQLDAFVYYLNRRFPKPVSA